jgi:hypothetical protein
MEQINKELEKKYIEAIIFRLHKEVIKQMKETPSNQLFGWKEKER